MITLWSLIWFGLLFGVYCEERKGGRVSRGYALWQTVLGTVAVALVMACGMFLVWAILRYLP